MERPRLIGITCLATALAAWPALSQHALYPDTDIGAVRERAERVVELMVSEDIPLALHRDERAGLGGIGVSFPVRAEQPLAVYSDPAKREVVVPIESALFIDDMATVQSWFHARGCLPTYIVVYLAALLGDRQPLPPPLEAFAIDADTALSDPAVAPLSAEISINTLRFLVAHEMAHLRLGHAASLTGVASQGQEMAADGFALDYFQAGGLRPMTLVGYFLAARWLDPTGAEVAVASHPVTPARLQAIADRLTAEPDAFAGGAEAAREMARIAGTMPDEASVRDLPLAHRQGFPLSRLATACPS